MHTTKMNVRTRKHPYMQKLTLARMPHTCKHKHMVVNLLLICTVCVKNHSLLFIIYMLYNNVPIHCGLVNIVNQE